MKAAMQPDTKPVVATAVSNISIPLVATFLFLANIVYGFPGIGTVDSDQQYAQAASGHLTDWHPPIMGWLWSHLPFFSAGNALLFILHVSFYWLGFGLIAFALGRVGQRAAAWGVILVGIAPPIISLDVHILNDVGLAVSFLSAFAIVFACR